VTGDTAAAPAPAKGGRSIRRWPGATRPWLPTDVGIFIGYQLLSAAVIFGLSRYHGIGVSSLSYRFRKWDASWLLSIAHHGYHSSGDRRYAIAFFPLYPAVVRAAMWIFHKDVVAAYAVSAVSSVVGHTAFYRALKARPELAAGAASSVLLLLVWPTTVYFSLLYTEGLYLMVTAGFLYFLLTDRVACAAVAAGLAALTRQPGFLCVVPLALWVLTDRDRAWPRRIRRIGWVAVGILGYGAFLVINRIVYHDWFAFVDALRTHWGKRSAPLTETIPDAIRFLRHPSWYFGWPDLVDHYAVLVSLVLLVAWPISCRRQFDRCRWTLLSWGAAQWLLIASSSAPTPGVGWISSTRYLMLVLPIYVAIVDLARNRRAVIYPLAAVGAVSSVMLVNRWVTKQWTA
jgi:hypothetical protein